MRIEAIARVIHAANRAYCQEIGDFSQLPWDEAPDWQQRSAIEAVHHVQQNPDVSPASLHDHWVRHKISEGWRWGEVKDAEAKTHPCMVDFDSLPIEQRCKDTLVTQIARILLSACRDD